MRRLSSLAWRSLLARPVRSALTVVGIALGVAVLFAALSTGESMDSAAERTASEQLGRAALRVTALEERGLSPDSVSIVEQTPGVAVAAPALERRTYVAAGDSAKLPPPVTIVGIDPERDPALHDLALTAQSVRLTPGLERSALISAKLAEEERLSIGDTITVNGAASGGPQPYRVVGIVTGGGPVPGSTGRFVVMPLAAAQTLFQTDGVTRVDVGTKPGTSTDEVVGQLEARLSVDPYLLERHEDVAADLRGSTDDLRATLLLVAALVLFAGAFLIFNTLSMTVAERAREVGLLRAAGTTRGQVTNFVLLQAAALGVVGTALGILAGIGLAAAATLWSRDSASLLVDGPSIGVDSVLVAVTVGMFVTLAAGLEPAWRAGRIPPVEALRRQIPTQATAARLRWLVFVLGALALAAALVWPRLEGPGGSAQAAAARLWAPLAVYALMVLAVLVLPVFLGPLLTLAGIPLRMFRNEERLARSALARDRSRTALTVGALVVGVAMVVALGTAAQTVREMGGTWLVETIPGSELLTSVRPMDTAGPARDEIAKLPGVASVSPIGFFGVPLDGVRQDAAAIVGRDYLADGRLTFVEGDAATALPALDAGGAVILPEAVAQRLGVHRGGTVEFATADTPASLAIAGIVAHSIPGTAGESILLGWTDATTTFGVAGADVFAVRYAAGQEASARPAVDAMARTYALEPADLSGAAGSIGDALERIFGLLDVLAIVAVLVAGLGVANTLSMSVLERVHEIGVLRATGMTSRQIWRMVVVEAAVLGIVGALIGAVVGLGVGMLLVGSSQGFTLNPSLPWPSIAFAAALGIAVSVVASMYPARLASRLAILRALKYE